MKMPKTVALAALAAALAATTPALAEREDLAADPFMAKYDMDRDGMLSKQEIMHMMEQVFDKQDTKKMGKLDKKQFELFLKELMKSGG